MTRLLSALPIVLLTACSSGGSGDADASTTSDASTAPSDASTSDSSSPPRDAGSGAGDGGAGCGNAESASAFLTAKAGTYAMNVAASGGDLTAEFTGTYRVSLAGPGRAFIEQITPTRAAPYQAFLWSFTSPPDTFQSEPNEINVLFESSPFRAVLQCERATGKLTLAASSKSDPRSFVRLVEP